MNEPPKLRHIGEFNENPVLNDDRPSTSRNSEKDRPTTNQNQDNESIAGQIDPNDNDDNETVRTSSEDPILNIHITDKPINNFLYQIMIIKVDRNP
ncbi:hypothetical protein JTB14_027488 [Gonioctena quinquepunctata]|nr:hypothetical protein JTB14_027488 [Gonioctena quinquepunctata]